MKTLTTLLNKYLAKIASFSHLSQLIDLQNLTKALKDSENNTLDDNLVGVIDSLDQQVDALVNIAKTQGVTAALSAKFRNELFDKVQKIASYQIPELASTISNIKSVLNEWVPVGIGAPAMNNFEFPETDIIIQRPEEKKQVKQNPFNFKSPIKEPSLTDTKFELPKTKEEEESWSKDVNGADDDESGSSPKPTPGELSAVARALDSCSSTTAALWAIHTWLKNNGDSQGAAILREFAIDYWEVEREQM